MTNSSMTGGLFHERLRASSTQLLLIGVAMTALGIAAAIFPMISTVVATLLVGGALLLSGEFLLLGYMAIDGTGPLLGAVLTSLLFIGTGAYVIFDPLGGATALTLLLGAAFLVHRVFEISFAFAIRPYRGWTIMLLSGAVGVAMAVLIAVGWSGISAILLGLLIGMNFLSTGLGYIFVSRARNLF
jgi:uncharacterized membrane protein HdeD (DUF308 family)